MKIKKLDELKVNEKGTIFDFTLEKRLLNHLFHLGFLPGTNIQLICPTPLKNPLVFYLRNYRIALSKEIAENILVII